MFRPATPSDTDRLTELFWNNLTEHPAYISHGEIQMGIAVNSSTLAEDGREKWKHYIEQKIAGTFSQVIVAENETGVFGFVVVDIEDDGDKPFGVVCDLLVAPGQRGGGTGKALLEVGIQWLEDRAITDFYLESGIGNHAAHGFFEKQGFRPISHIFKRGN